MTQSNVREFPQPSDALPIRRANKADLPALVKMGRRFMSETDYGVGFDEASFINTVLGLMGNPFGAVFVAGEPAVGMCAGVLFPLFCNVRHMTGQELFWWVEKSHRRGGTGKALLEAMEAWAKDAGAESFMMMRLEKLNPKPVGAMLEGMGYRPSELTYLKRL